MSPCLLLETVKTAGIRQGYDLTEIIVEMSRRKSSSRNKPSSPQGSGSKGSAAKGAVQQNTPSLPMHADDAALWAEVTKSLTPLKDEHDRLHFGPLLDEKPTLSGQWPSAPAATVNGGQGTRGNKGTAQTSLAKSGGSAGKQAVPVPSIPELGSLSRRDMRKIDRGHQPIEARLDLHGMYQSAAHAALRGFLTQSQNRGLRHVLVITGKGRPNSRDDMMFGEPETGVLRRMVPLWLGESDLRSIVSGYSEAPRRLGGEGALYVRLRRLR
jgi:DNA-nicking Smr family endonuclease